MQLRQRGERIAQCRYIPWTRGLECDARNDALNIGPVANDGADRVGLGMKCRAGFKPCGNDGTIPQRMMQPFAQAPRTHVGRGVIQKRKKGRRRFARDRFGNFQIASRGGIHADEIIVALDREADDVR